jgi:Ca-activated chloride channel family protein
MWFDRGFFGWTFQEPLWLLCLILLPVVVFLQFKKENSRSGDRKFTGSTELQDKLHVAWIPHFRKFLIVAEALSFVLMAVALAKPRQHAAGGITEEEYKNGIDIVIAIDVSLSMMAEDFKPNRLEAAKKVSKEFVSERRGDRIGLVVYAGEAYAPCPGTIDYEALLRQIDSVGYDPLEGGTAIGTGLGTAVTKLKDEKLRSKVIILLTDGSNNAGDIDPMTAAELAREKNILVYTIGVGSNGEALTPVPTPFGVRMEKIPVEIDEKTLHEIAKRTGGNYFRATNESALSEIYNKIDAMEKRKQLQRKVQREEPANPHFFLWIALVLLTGSWILKRIFFYYEI